MDDEATLLPRKLQAALEQSLEQRNDIINQDSDSESDEGEKPDVVALPICLQWTHYLHHETCSDCKAQHLASLYFIPYSKSKLFIHHENYPN